MSRADMEQSARDELKKGDNVRRAQVYALLAIGVAIEHLAEVLDAKADGSVARPVHVVREA